MTLYSDAAKYRNLECNVIHILIKIGKVRNVVGTQYLSSGEVSLLLVFCDSLVI
jgi:hypothetical protein